jgi:hypothetical protein
MPYDPRDQLWEGSFETLYHVFYEEYITWGLINQWQKIDEITKVVVALTASGSAVAGWTLWNEPYFKTIWASIAGFAAVLSIIHTALRVPERIKEHGEAKLQLINLRIDLETFRYRMCIDPNFSIESFTQEFVEYRKRYAQYSSS